MSECLMTSQGFAIGRWYFPAFSLRLGECISLCLPQDARRDEERIVAALSSSESAAGLSLTASVAVAEPASSSSPWWSFQSGPTPFDWLRTRTRMPDDAIELFLREHRMERHIPLSSYAGTPRMALGLCAAYARGPSVIVFSTTGLDPSGVREIFQIVSEHLPECSAIYMGWPFYVQDKRAYEQFPGSLSVTVGDREGAPAPETSAAQGVGTE